MTHDMHSDNDIIQGIAEAFWEVTEGTAKECLDLAEVAYNAACSAGMVTPHEVMATTRYLSAALGRVEELEDGIRQHRQDSIAEDARDPRVSVFDFPATYTHDDALWALLEQEASDA